MTDGPPYALRSGDVYFVGTAASVVEEPQSRGYGTRRYLFTVTEAFAGVSGAVQEVVSTMSSCGVEFSQGRSYLVAARLASAGTVRVRACSRTAPAEDALDEMEILRSLGSGQEDDAGVWRHHRVSRSATYNLATDPELYQHLPNVRVTIAGAGGIRETVTDAAGTFRVDDLPPGRYRVSAHLQPPKRAEAFKEGSYQEDSDPEELILQGCPIRVHFSVSGSPSTSGEPARPTAQRCEHESQPSPASTTPSTVTFDNARNSPARLYWIDFEGRRIFYHLLLPGETLVQPTYRSHPRVATSEEGQCLGLFEANSSASVVTLGAIDR